MACSLDGVAGEAGSTARIALPVGDGDTTSSVSVSLNARLPLRMAAQMSGGRQELEACVRFNGTYFPQSMRWPLTVPGRCGAVPARFVRQLCVRRGAALHCRLDSAPDDFTGGDLVFNLTVPAAVFEQLAQRRVTCRSAPSPAAGRRATLTAAAQKAVPTRRRLFVCLFVRSFFCSPRLLVCLWSRGGLVVRRALTSIWLFSLRLDYSQVPHPVACR